MKARGVRIHQYDFVFPNFGHSFAKIMAKGDEQ